MSENENQNEQEDEKDTPRSMLRYATVGMEFFLTFMFFLVAGYLLDDYVLGTFPGFSILGAIVGFAAGFYRITRQGWGILKWAQKEHEQEERRRRQARKSRQGKN
jgi:F0F1-type ATP synthase assembly protein I